MAKYRKTALVDAEQFLPPNQIPTGCYQKGTMGDVANGHGEWFLKTLEGEHPLRHADYVCTGIQGERWNVERSIFDATYEPAANAEPTPTPSPEEVAGLVERASVKPDDYAGLAAALKRIAWQNLGGHYTIDGVDALNAADALASLSAQVAKQREALATAKLVALTFKSGPRALSRITRICIDAGITEKLCDGLEQAADIAKAVECPSPALAGGEDGRG